jgi:F-type H+-transporting ATPase subunit b
MPFDWFTIAAQTINFLALLWLLKRYLYHPILNGLDARERRLKKILDNANNKNIQAEKRKYEFECQQQELEEKRSSIIKKATIEANQERQKLFHSAQLAADNMLTKRLRALQDELRNLQHSVLIRNIDEVYATAEKILSELASTQLQHAMFEKFLFQLKNITNEQQPVFLSALKRANYLVLVRCAFELSDRDKNQMKQALETLLGEENSIGLSISFVHVPELIAGLEMSVSGWKLAWSVSHHIQRLKEQVHENIQQVQSRQQITPKKASSRSATAH